MGKKNADKTTRFLTTSIILVSIVCVCIFSFLAFYMGQRSRDTINKVGTLYMSSMSEQVSLHFETTIELSLSQVEALRETNEMGKFPDSMTVKDALAYNGRAQGFDSLALYSVDGVFETLYGDSVQVDDPESFLRSLNAGEKKAAIGTGTQGDKIILLGVPANYPMGDGLECAALVAGIPVSYIGRSLSLDENDRIMYSFIIRRDGSFVIRSADAYRGNYFERVRDLYEDVGGKDAEQYIAELSAAMEANEDYSSEFQIYGERRHLYCTRLSYSEWYLITFMPYDTLDANISHLSTQWIFMTIGSCIIILVLLLLVFKKYFDMTRSQIYDLENAQRAAEEAQRAAEEAQKEAENASKAKSEFLSNMSHDIRTPMNAIVGMTAIAIANFQNQQQVQNCLKKISLSSRHLLGLINDVLDMSKIESGKMTLNYDQISLREVMESMVNIVQPQVKAKNQQFDVSIHDISVENVCCDSIRLNQVLLNLLSNAVKFTPEGNSIQVALYQEESPKGEDYIRNHFWVKDTGIGMSPEFQKRIFESFVREDNARVNKTEGTGLGMAITKYIVDAMGGAIEVESEQGKGSEFHIILDLQKALIQEADMVLPPWRMLVVDDDQALCESAAASLKSIGVQPEWTLDGETALKMVDERHGRHEDYHVILLDWKLPGMDGIETAREIRRRLGEEVPVLLISAYDWSDIEDDAREAGVNGFISKPLFKSTLFYGLRSFAENQSEQPEEETESRVELTGRRVLLAEDNELNWEIANELLSDLGLVLEWAENGQICVEKFRASETGYYDAVLMDLRMPVMNGYEAAQAIRFSGRIDADIPIIAMTADAFAEDVQRCLEHGMNGHIAKPIDVLEVERMLEKYMH